MTLADTSGVVVTMDAAGRRVLTHPEATTITADLLVQRARDLIPILRERATRTESLRTLTPETIADFHAAGFFRICQPRRFGGFEMGMETLQSVLVEIGRGCASSAWVLGILAGHAWWASQFPEAGQEEIFGDAGIALLPTGIFGRGGRATKVEGGYRLSGRWHYQSGCDLANWYGCGANLVSESGPPVGLSFSVETPAGRIEDDWHVMGMKGTGSKTVVVENAFVQESRAIYLADMEAQDLPGSRLHDNPLYSTPLLAFISIEVTGAAVGNALGAVDVLEEMGRTKPMRARGGGGGETATFEMSRPSFRRRLGEAKTLAETAMTMLLSESKRLTERAIDIKREGRKMTREEISEVTLMQSRLVEMSVQAVKHCFIAAGTSATVQGHPMERMLRDAYMMSMHRVLQLDTAAEAWAPRITVYEPYLADSRHLLNRRMESMPI